MFSIWLEFVAFSAIQPKTATPQTMPNFYVYYITRNCHEFRDSLLNFQNKFTPVSGGPVHRQLSLKIRPDATMGIAKSLQRHCQSLLMQSWKPSSCNDTHITFERHLHGYPCICMAHAHASRVRMHMHMRASCNKSHMQHVHMQASIYASSYNVGSTSCAILCSTTMISSAFGRLC